MEADLLKLVELVFSNKTTTKVKCALIEEDEIINDD